MAFERPGEGALDYIPCGYGESKLVFRGPKRRLKDPYVVFLGGTETFGKFVVRPYPDLIESRIAKRMVNLGSVNAGIDTYLNDHSLLDIASKARATVIQIMGTQNISNRFYSVHPRRNDRFLKASTLMKTVFREIDFTDFSFTGHLLTTLKEKCPDRYPLLVDELRTAWKARMHSLLDKVQSPTILLWIGETGLDGMPEDFHPHAAPPFVDRPMIDELEKRVDHFAEVVASDEAQFAGTTGMVFSEFEAPAAERMPGIRFHEEVAEALAPLLVPYLR